MTERFQRRTPAFWGRIALAGIATAALMTGCGGSGSGGGTTQPTTVTLTGQLEDTTTKNVLPNRTVSVENTSLSATSDASGNFTISSVPVESITLSIVDSNNTSDGTAIYDLSKYSGDPRNIGIVSLDLSKIPPPPSI